MHEPTIDHTGLQSKIAVAGATLAVTSAVVISGVADKLLNKAIGDMVWAYSAAGAALSLLYLFIVAVRLADIDQDKPIARIINRTFEKTFFSMLVLYSWTLVPSLLVIPALSKRGLGALAVILCVIASVTLVVHLKVIRMLIIKLVHKIRTKRLRRTMD